MNGRARFISWQPMVASGLLALLGISLSGCSDKYYQAAAATPHPFVDQGYKPDVPDYLHGTVFERTDVFGAEPTPVTGYSLVVDLQDTGDNSDIATPVRQAIIKRLELADESATPSFNRYDDPRFTKIEPEDVLRDKRVAVVQVIGMLPAGARRGQRFDVVVRAMPNSRTTSLAHGHMYNTELRDHGLMEPQGGGLVRAYADDGDVFVNPVYALEGSSKKYANATNGEVGASLRYGAVLNSGRVTEDRPIHIALRVPQASIARAIEARINTRIPQDDGDRPAASAQDEGLVDVYVPLSYRGDWRHFLGLIDHLYLNDAPDLQARRVSMLVAAAHRKGAGLEDISFCLEGLGPSYVPFYESMVNDSDPAVAFCGARAAAMCGDEVALEALTQMATDSRNEMQLAAVEAMGELPPSPVVDKRLEMALGSEKDLVRIEAYKILADHGDRRIMVEEAPTGFELDIVDYPGSPLIYASRSGAQRIAVFGRTAQITPPLIFSAMHDRFMIASDDVGSSLTLFYRDPQRSQPLKIVSGTNLAEVIGRLGGKGPHEQDNLTFGYPDVVALVQALSDDHDLTGADSNGAVTGAPLIVDNTQELASVLAAASLEARPQTDRPGRSLGGGNSSIPQAAAPTSQVPSFSGAASGPPQASAQPVATPAQTVAPTAGGTVPSFSNP
jgi:flagellar basal body P-ring protein FlgI